MVPEGYIPNDSSSIGLGYINGGIASRFHYRENLLFFPYFLAADLCAVACYSGVRLRRVKCYIYEEARLKQMAHSTCTTNPLLSSRLFERACIILGS